MKRGREESYMGSQIKRPATSRGESSGPPQPSGGSQRLTTDDAPAYPELVKEIFKDRREKYDEFLEAMEDVRAQRIDTLGVIARMKELFKGHPNLMSGFYGFLCEGYGITLVEGEPAPKKQPVDFEKAIKYVNKIKTRFQYHEVVYKDFLEILNMYRKGNTSIRELYHKVVLLFKDDQDLLEKFAYFLPDSSGSAHVSHAPTSARAASVPAVRRDERSLGLASRHSHVGKREKTVSSQADHDRSAERPSDHDVDKTSIKHDKDHRKRIEKEKERKEDRKRKEHDRDEKDSEQDRDRDLDPMQRHKRKSARRANELIRKQTQGGEGGEDFVGQSVLTSSLENKNVLKIDIPIPEERRLDLPLDKVKQRKRRNDRLKDLGVYYPARDAPESVEIRYCYMKCLAPDTCLSSPIMDFYIRYLQSPDSITTSAKCTDYHFFNMYFYIKLNEELQIDRQQDGVSLAKLRRWLKGVNIFEKAYIFVPIHCQKHWSLAVICIPAREDKIGPIILHLDSLNFHCSTIIFQNIRRFLKAEWECLNQAGDLTHIPIEESIRKTWINKIETKKIEVPQQKNNYDCGLFVLYFMERFIKDAPPRVIMSELDKKFGKKWFKPAEASCLRDSIKTFLEKLFEDELDAIDT